MTMKRLIFSILAMALGVFLFVFGEYDDSPGGQLLGLVIAILGIVSVVKSKNKVS